MAVLCVVAVAVILVGHRDRYGLAVTAALGGMTGWWLARAVADHDPAAFLPLGASFLAFLAPYLVVRCLGDPGPGPTGCRRRRRREPPGRLRRRGGARTVVGGGPGHRRHLAGVHDAHLPGGRSRGLCHHPAARPGAGPRIAPRPPGRRRRRSRTARHPVALGAVGTRRRGAAGATPSMGRRVVAARLRVGRRADGGGVVPGTRTGGTGLVTRRGRARPVGRAGAPPRGDVDPAGGRGCRAVHRGRHRRRRPPPADRSHPADDRNHPDRCVDGVRRLVAHVGAHRDRPTPHLHDQRTGRHVSGVRARHLSGAGRRRRTGRGPPAGRRRCGGGGVVPPARPVVLVRGGGDRGLRRRRVRRLRLAAPGRRTAGRLCRRPGGRAPSPVGADGGRGVRSCRPPPPGRRRARVDRRCGCGGRCPGGGGVRPHRRRGRRGR